MKRSILVIGALMLCGLPLFAQDVPKAELFMGFEYIRFNPALSAAGSPNFNMYGGGGSIMFNVNKVVGLKAEFTGAGAGDMKVCASTGLDCLTRSGNFFTYMFGPQFSIRNQSRVTPWVHALFGGAYSNVYGNLQSAGTVSITPPVADFGKHAFALAAGGGIDVKASKSVSIRLIEMDYFMTRFSGREVSTSGTGSLGNLQISNQSNTRILAGIVFNIGSK